MTHINYDEQRLIDELERLPNQLRVAFAAACAERLLPAFEAFSDRTQTSDGQLLAALLARLWLDLEGETVTASDIDQAIEVSMNSDPEGSDNELNAEGWEAASDAAAATCYAFRCLKTGDSQEAAWAARRAYNALDTFVIDKGNIDTSVPGSRQRVLSHPLIQAELHRQLRDLDDLRSSNETNISNLVSHLRERAKLEARTFFGSP